MSEQIIKTILLGECGEGYPWEIVTDYAIYEALGGKACEHAKRTEAGELVVPRVARCRNEGGNNTTELCIDCLLDAVSA